MLHSPWPYTQETGAVGVDGQTAEEYEVNLEANSQNLLDRALNPARTWRRPCDEHIFPRQARPMRLVRWEYPRLRTKSFSVRS